MDTDRRKIIRNLALTPILLGSHSIIANTGLKTIIPKNRVQYSVNAYAFDAQLRSGEMTFFDMMEFAANIGLDAVDLTGYYFATYPEIPTNNEHILDRSAK
jgi:hypothetical protein